MTLGEWLDAVADLAMPLACHGCGAESLRWCQTCALDVESAWAGPRMVSPDPRPPGLPLVAARAPYAPPLSQLLHAWKDEGDESATAILAPLLRSSAELVLQQMPPRGSLVVVPVPSAKATRRRRGWSPVASLTAQALPELRLIPALAHQRRVSDQAGLTQRSRHVNLAGALAATRRGRELAGARVLLVDDIVTTGSTVVEAARACRAAGAAAVCAATVAATPRRRA